MVNSTFRNILTLLSGNVLARIFTFALTPLLTRLFLPEDFGVLAIYTSILAPLGVICTGRYNLAIFLPVKKENALDVVNLGLIISMIISIVVIVFLSFFYNDLGNILSLKGNGYLLIFIPVSLIFLASIQSYTNYFNRESRYKLISTIIVLQTLVTSGVQISCGFLGLKPSGLIIGQFSGTMLAGVLFYVFAPKLKFNKINISLMAKKYSQFPLLSIWSALLDSIALQIPIWLITKSYLAESVGAFAFIFKVINVPLSIISDSITRVLHKKISELYREKPEKISKLIIKFLFLLAVMGIPVIIIFFSWGSELFNLIFGNKWDFAGELSEVLVFSFVIRFIISPLSSILAMDRHLKKGIMWQVTYFITTSIVLYIASNYSFEIFIKVFVFHEIVLYLLYLIIIFYAASIEKIKENHVAS